MSRVSSRVATSKSKTDGGVVMVDGEPMTTRSVRAKSAIGYVPQDLAIYPDLSGRENLMFFARLYGMSTAEARRRITEVLTLTGLADRVLSTSGIIRFARESEANDFIICAEVGILHRLRKENPSKRFFAASDDAVCHRMKMIRLETLLWTLENMEYPIKVPDRIARKVRPRLETMLEA